MTSATALCSNMSLLHCSAAQGMKGRKGRSKRRRFTPATAPHLLPASALQSALAHAVCNGAFLAVKRKSMAAHAAYLAGRSGLAGAATPQGQPRPTGAALAGGRGASGSQGSGSGLAGLPTIQEVTAASKAGAAAPRQVLEKEPQVVTSTGAGAAQAAGVLQRGGPGAQELVQAAGAESQGACVGLMQPEKESAEPGSPPGWGCRPAAASVGRKWHAAATAPLLCRRRIPKYISRSTTQFQVCVSQRACIHPALRDAWRERHTSRER